MWNPLILLFPAAARLQSTKEKHLNTEVQEQESNAVHVDVLIVGAGISGIGSAYHLQQQCPTKLRHPGDEGHLWRYLGNP